MSKRVLVVDDERHIVRLIQVNLERLGHEVMCAFDGREAIELLNRQAFDRAIVDFMVPYVDGYGVLTWIRTHPETRGMWVALMTAQADEMREDLSIEHRANLYVKKPFNPSGFP